MSDTTLTPAPAAPTTPAPADPAALRVPLPPWAKAVYVVVSAVISVTVAVVGAYADVKSDVRDNRTITTEHGRRVDRLEESLSKVAADVADIKADVRYLRSRAADQ